MLKNIVNKLNDISYPSYVTFGKFRVLMDYSNPVFKNSMTFYKEDVKRSMSYNEVMILANKYRRDIDLGSITRKLVDANKNLSNSIEKYNPPVSVIRDLHDFTFFTPSLDELDITNLVRKYNLSSFDVFYNMVSSEVTLGMETNGFGNLTKSQIKEYYERELSLTNQSYVYIDYCNKTEVNFMLPINPNDNDTPFKININEYNQINNNSGFDRILSMLMESKHNINPSFKQYSPEFKSSNTNPINYIKIQTINDLVDLDTNKDSIVYQSIVEQKKYTHAKQNSMNIDCSNNWNYLTTPYYLKHIKPFPEYCELAYGFDYSHGLVNKYNIKLNYNVPFDSISVINMLMFGKTNVNYMMIERLLGLVRYNITKENVQLDNFVIQYTDSPYMCLTNKKYKIAWSEYFDNISFAQTDMQKLTIAHYILQLMNEVDPDILNFHNYYEISNWYRTNEDPIKTHNDIVNSQIVKMGADKSLIDNLYQFSDYDNSNKIIFL